MSLAYKITRRVLGLTVLLLCAASASAQTPALRTVAFTASADHNATMADGTVLVTRYELVIVKTGAAPTTVATLDLGKPTPDAANAITLSNVPLPAALTPGDYTGRLTAIGPGGRSPDAVTSPFSVPRPPAAPTAPLVKP